MTQRKSMHSEDVPLRLRRWQLFMSVIIPQKEQTRFPLFTKHATVCKNMAMITKEATLDDCSNANIARDIFRSTTKQIFVPCLRIIVVLV